MEAIDKSGSEEANLKNIIAAPRVRVLAGQLSSGRGSPDCSLERYRGSTSALVVKASSKCEGKAEADPSAKHCRVPIVPMKASGKLLPLTGTERQHGESEPRSAYSAVSGFPMG